MIHRLKISVILAATAACVLGASASAASAAHFKATKYPVEVEAKQENLQGFKITGAVSVCKKAKFIGELTAESETLIVSPTYFECTVELAGTHEAVVKTNGCTYKFHAVAAGENTGTVDIECPTGKEIEVEVKGITGCFIKVPGGQTGLGKVKYTNTEGPPKKVLVEANITGIKWSTAAACNITPSSGTNGEYREGLVNGAGEPELGAGAAKALASGFVPKTAEKLGIEIA